MRSRLKVSQNTSDVINTWFESRLVAFMLKKASGLSFIEMKQFNIVFAFWIFLEERVDPGV